MSATANDALTTARAYHDAWTAHRFERATALLSDSLRVEVPINTYPTKHSFTTALAGFGATVDQVDLLAAIGDDQEAMLLYDLHNARLGTMRVAEHFTVSAGQITRLRQIHDTAVIRQAGLRPATATANPNRYNAMVAIAAPCDQVFAALTTLDGLAQWWTPFVTGTPERDGELRFRFDTVDEVIRMRVDAIAANRSLTWTCLEHSADPDWAASTITFQLAGTGTCTTLNLTHNGIAADHVQRGWEHFLASIASYLETGTGQPYISS